MSSAGGAGGSVGEALSEASAAAAASEGHRERAAAITKRRMGALRAWLRENMTFFKIGENQRGVEGRRE